MGSPIFWCLLSQGDAAFPLGCHALPVPSETQSRLLRLAGKVVGRIKERSEAAPANCEFDCGIETANADFCELS